MNYNILWKIFEIIINQLNNFKNSKPKNTETIVVLPGIWKIYNDVQFRGIKPSIGYHHNLSIPTLLFFVALIIKCSYNYFTEQFFLTDPELKDTVPNEYLSHKEKYEVAVRKACLIMKKIREFSEQGHGGVDSYRSAIELF